MLHPVDTRIPSAVQDRVQEIYRGLFPEAGDKFVPQAFQWAIQCFTGRYADYQAIDAGYHDFEHTLQGTLCMALILQGRAAAKTLPAVTLKMFELGLLAILFHDTGYLKKKGDAEGTGAKYTLVHVGRSAVFAAKFLEEKGFVPSDILAVQNMIRCTGVDADLESIAFQSAIEKTIGFALATADLLGQMAAVDYVKKLPVLYLEFAECARFTKPDGGRMAAFTSAEDLMRKTPGFWQHYVLPRITVDFGKLHLFLNEPYPDGPNNYLQRIEEHIGELRQRFPQN